jgi:hypothetical protein
VGSSQNIFIVAIKKDSVTENQIELLLGKQFTALAYARHTDRVYAKPHKRSGDSAAVFCIRRHDRDLPADIHFNLSWITREQLGGPLN